VQHDDRFGAGAGADRIAEVLDDLRVPAIVVLHSVFGRPTPPQRQAVQRIVAAAGAAVVLTAAARERLLSGYGVDARQLTAIPHGAPARHHGAGPAGASPLILTWGLLGPGKGVEWAIGGLRQLRDLHPTPRYIVVGETQMAVRQRQGEAYRLGLVSRAKALSVTGLVSYRTSYLDSGTLDRLIRRADVILVPTDSPEPVASAVLVEAIAAGKPVIAAAFPHAAELLGGGAGLLVPVRDSAAIGDALRRMFTEPGLPASLAAQASRLAPGLSWPAVADRYRALARRLLDDARRLPRRP
jgi:glycosyltransferase involved in cell wall biosynthesis